MGNCLEMRTGSMKLVVELIETGSQGSHTPRQAYILETARSLCGEYDRELAAQDIAFKVSVAQALEELLAGRAADGQGPAYTYAFYQLVCSCFSDPFDLGVWRRPSVFWDLGSELAALGVPRDLRPDDFLSTAARDFVSLPHPGDYVPSIGTLETAKARALVDAYTAVLDRLSPAARETAEVLLTPLGFEAREYESMLEDGDTPADCIVFWLL